MFSKFTSAIACALVQLSRSRPFQTWLQQLLAAYKIEQTLVTAVPGVEVPEVLPLNPVLSFAPCSRRLNLLVPAVSTEHVFGGIATALQVFNDLRVHFDVARIIVTDEVIPHPHPEAYYGGWPVVMLEHPLPDQNHIVAAGSRWGQSLAVHEHDYFMATAWWTAQVGLAIVQWQRDQYPQAAERRLLYFIQDYEPGFYSWSSRYVLAQATYAKSDRTIALINSTWLADYLQDQGHDFSFSRVFHPRLHPGLMRRRQQTDSFVKDRVLLVYGRPGTERNAFSLVVSTLKSWVHGSPNAHKWTILSAGEAFAPIDLGNGCQLRSVGKLDIEAYADLLHRTAVGLSLMVSPHPSYPPLEMAAFGAQVVTNGFANKNLSALSSFLHSVPGANLQALSHTLRNLTEAFEALEPAERKIAVASIDWNDNFFVAPADPVPDWGQEIAQALLQDSTI